MVLLADCLLEVDGEVFGTSLPEKGDIPSGLDGHPQSGIAQLSLGVSAVDVPRLTRLQGKVGWLVEQNGNHGAWIRIEKVDPELKVLVGTVLSEGPPHSRVVAGALDTRLADHPSDRQAQRKAGR
jgi:hypothetical protein